MKARSPGSGVFFELLRSLRKQRDYFQQKQKLADITNGEQFTVRGMERVQLAPTLDLPARLHPGGDGAVRG
ncbi:MAG TPA: hypothetical protein VF690_15845 [Hymenobacter sp.]|jgi:hypothetical protein